MLRAAVGQAQVRALSVHAGYTCAHSGVCCRAGWTIPVDAATRDTLDDHLARHRLQWLPAGAPAFVAYDPDDPARVAFAHDASGACAFLARDGSSLCGIHRTLGEAALPQPCRQFPRVALVCDEGVDVTLSHFCPTAAARLVDWDAPLCIVTDPACARRRVLEGLDTRGHVPPLVRPGVMHSTASWQRLEAAAVALLDGTGTVGGRLDALDRWMRRIEAWTPGDGPLESLVDRVVDDAAGGGDPARHERGGPADGWPAALADWHRAWEAVPRPRATPPAGVPAPAVLERAAIDLSAWDGAVGRYLAAKVFASWIPWLATRSATVAQAVRLAYHVVVVEAGRQPPLGRAAVIAALRQADLLLLHLAEPASLAQLVERASPTSGASVPRGHDRRRL